MARRSIVVALVALGMLVLAPIAPADTGNILMPQSHPARAGDGFQAGPCTGDLPLQCNSETFPQFFKTAAGHPPEAFIKYIVQHEVPFPGDIEPLVEPIEARISKDVQVDLPPGLSVNPEATEQCSLQDFLHAEPTFFEPLCKPGSMIGETEVNLVTGVDDFLGLPKGKRFFTGVLGVSLVSIFNIEPVFGEPALFGFVIAHSVRILMRPEIAWDSDYHESFTIKELPDLNTIKLGGTVVPAVIRDARLSTFGTVGDGTLATLPTTCFNSDAPQFKHLYSSWMRQDSYAEPDPLAFPLGLTAFESAPPTGVHPEGCASIPFDPFIEVFPGATEVDSPAASHLTVRMPVKIPVRGDGPIAESHLRSISVTLPEGMGLNPAGSVGLLACPDAAFHKGQRIAVNSCPSDSVIGGAEIKSPLLPEALKGNVYVGEPKSTDPASGEEFRILVEAKSEEFNVVVRLIGKVRADPATGRLVARFDEQEVSPFFGSLPAGLPQVPFEFVVLRFNSVHKILSSPPTCASSSSRADLEPWARPGTSVSSISTFTLSSVPGGGECPKTLAARKFAPISTSGSDRTVAGAFSPFRVHVSRPPGEQEIKRLDLTLPRGLIGKLAGIPYCPEGQIAAASAKSGAAERREPSCPASSLVGSASIETGTGATPLKLSGQVYLSGPYKDAPLSLAIVTPGISGPFDLGNVVTRVALEVDPLSAQISAISDVLPDVFGGVKLDLRTIDVALDRPGFTLNPTNCAPQSITGALAGGGSDPSNPAAFSSVPIRTPAPLAGCDGLGFRPKLTTKLSGPTKRHTYPRLSATLKARPGDANIAAVSLLLPHAFFVAQEHIGTVCTRSQLAAHACPEAAIYGQAEATSPLLGDKLSGPVYLVPGGHPLPDLVADLRGQLNIQLHGVISSRRGGIAAVFGSVPDVPLTKFSLQMKGGKRGLIVNSTNICRHRHPAVLKITGQNGARLKNNRYRLNLAGCKKHRKHHRHKGQ